MALRFKIDEDLPQEIATRLCAAGYDAVTIREERLGGAFDSRVWDVAQEEQRCLITADKGFADASRYPPGTHGGIVLLRLPHESRSGYIRLVDGLLASLPMGDMQGAIVSVSPEAIRVHRGAK